MLKLNHIHVNCIEFSYMKVLNAMIFQIPVGASEDKDEEDAEEVEGWTLDDDEEGDGVESIFKFKGKYLGLLLEEFV